MDQFYEFYKSRRGTVLRVVSSIYVQLLPLPRQRASLSCTPLFGTHCLHDLLLVVRFPAVGEGPDGGSQPPHALVVPVRSSYSSSARPLSSVT